MRFASLTRPVAVLFGALIALPLAARGDEARTFVGPLEGAVGPAQVALVIEGETLLAYTCGADDEFNRKHARWFKGTVQDGAFEVQSADGLKLAGRVAGDKVTGSFRPKEGDAYRFAATVPPKGPAGLYRAARDGEFVAGWIVAADHTVVGACKKKGGQVGSLRPARPLPKAQADDPPAEVQQQAEEALVVQPEPAAEPVQGQRVKSPTAPPAGKAARKSPARAKK